jgi:general nucleoside transport system permease protein
MSGGTVTAFLESGVRFATPLAYAALGELVVERAGVINIGLEGAIIGGAFGALVFASAGSVSLGFAGAALAGVIVAVIFALFVVTLRTDQIITGTALSMLGLGLTGTLYRTIYGSSGASLHTPTIASAPIPGLSAIPVLGPALFDQPVVTYALYVIVPLLAWWFYRTAGGLALRAVGEHPEAARAAGISPDRVQWAALLFGGAMGGIGGGTLVLAQVGTFAEGMSAGRGFIAIAIVVLGRWTPFGVAGAALVFGAASALQTLAQTTGWAMPYEVPLAFPYVLTLVLLASARTRTAAPAALGQLTT